MFQSPQSGSMGQSMQITKLVFTPTGTFNPVHHRAFSLSGKYDLQTISSMQQATQFGNSITMGSMAPYAGKLLRPTADLTTAIQIANGWDTPRLRFMMEVAIQTMGASMIQYITGFTNYQGVSDLGYGKASFDPAMLLYFNSVVTLQNTPYDNGAHNSLAVVESSHVLSGPYNPGFSTQQASEQTAYSVRAEDVFSVMQTGSAGGYPNLMDARITFADNNPKRCRRKNEAPSRYMSTILSGYRSSIQGDVDMSGGIGDAMDTAISHVAEASILDNPLFFAISNRIGFDEGGSITYGQLCSLTSDLDDRVQIPRGGVSELHTTGRSANWNGGNVETIAAHMIATQVPAIMSDLMLTKIMFTATNNTIGGEYLIDVLGHHEFAKIDMSAYISAFIHRVQHEILESLSNNRTIRFNIRVNLDMYGETHIYVSMNGAPEQYYCLPSFADALLAPTMAYDLQQVLTLASDFEIIGNNLGIDHNQRPGAQHDFGSI